MYDVDSYGEVLNGPGTYAEIVEDVGYGASALVGWTDGLGTHFDILFTRRPACPNPANIQGGVRAGDLFVSIMRVGAFGFEINGLVKHHGYVAEKLHLGDGPTSERVADLINGVIAQLQAP